MFMSFNANFRVHVCTFKQGESPLIYFIVNSTWSDLLKCYFGFHPYLCHLPVSTLLHTTEGLNSYIFLSLSLFAGAFLCFGAALSHKLCALLKCVSWTGSQGMGSHELPPQPSPGYGLVQLTSPSDSGEEQLMVGHFSYSSVGKLEEVFSFCLG